MATKIPKAKELIYSGICDGDSDTTEFFHCTPAKNLESILKNGIRRGEGKTFRFLRDHAKGKIFLAIGYEEAVQWQGMIAEQLLEEVAILQVYLTKEQKEEMRTDVAGYQDGMVCSVYLCLDIKPNQIKVVDTGQGSLDHVDMESEEPMEESGSLEEVLSFLVKEDAEPEFGKYLFGQERGLPTKKNPEKNTPKENELGYAITNHYNGEMEELVPWIQRMAELEDDGLYLDILGVPKKYRYAYRVLYDLRYEDLYDILGGEPEDATPGKMVHSPEGGTFYATASGDEREHFSWTVRPEAFKDILNDWGRYTNPLSTGMKKYIVFLRAKIHSDGNRFLFNPDNPTLRKKAGQFAYQDEIISVGDVRCDSVWYADASKYLKSSDKFEKAKEFDVRTTRQMVGHSKELDEDVTNTALDIAGLIPGVGEAADLANAALYAAKQEYLLAGLSLISAVPAIGDMIGKGGKLALWVQKTFPKASKQIAKYGPDVVASINALKAAILKNKNTIKKLFDVIETEADKAPVAKKLAPYLPKLWQALDVFTKTSPTDSNSAADTLAEQVGLGEYSGPKKYVKKTADGKTVRYGAKGYRIAPGTSKGDSYCARSAGQMKKHPKAAEDPNSPLRLSRKKWKCSGEKSRRD